MGHTIHESDIEVRRHQKTNLHWHHKPKIAYLGFDLSTKCVRQLNVCKDMWEWWIHFEESAYYWPFDESYERSISYITQTMGVKEVV